LHRLTPVFPDGLRIISKLFFIPYTPEIVRYIASIENSGIKQLTFDNTFNDQNASWSQNEKWIYFESDRSGEYNIWKIPAEGGKAIQVTFDEGYAPLEVPDGEWLYFN
jgi:Tol biopolymer transport system component